MQGIESNRFRNLYTGVLFSTYFGEVPHGSPNRITRTSRKSSPAHTIRSTCNCTSASYGNLTRDAAHPASEDSTGCFNCDTGDNSPRPGGIPGAPLTIHVTSADCVAHACTPRTVRTTSTARTDCGTIHDDDRAPFAHTHCFTLARFRTVRTSCNGPTGCISNTACTCRIGYSRRRALGRINPCR